ncbi:hypothetical protein ABNIH16_19591 [Acinetobacter baumannii ABNIH16]|nr:hypothetical protein ABNIH1_06492 [Acinetobacter baumannii ABNIH1]EMT84137.1 hypothetical protein ABNIH25_14662 [Acinetobacter baumannii ABNIH25]EMU17297.1 hypothetical protein ABNIH16_19591 [Acinetobacter baumannii ABNIH16]OBE37964.1 hypothetical protein A7928_08385 [Acinetobacter baumannii]OBN08558.1 hypothetical protein A9875_09835 [Acinetobacter baumannii]
MKIVNFIFNLFLFKINGLNKFIKLLLKKDLIFKLNFEIIVMQIVIYFPQFVFQVKWLSLMLISFFRL